MITLVNVEIIPLCMLTDKPILEQLKRRLSRLTKKVTEEIYTGFQHPPFLRRTPGGHKRSDINFVPLKNLRSTLGPKVVSNGLFSARILWDSVTTPTRDFYVTGGKGVSVRNRKLG